MRAEEEGRRGEEGSKGKWIETRGGGVSRSSYGGRGRNGGDGGVMLGDRRNYNFGRGNGFSGSDGPTWRKDGLGSRNSGRSSGGGGEDKQVTSPLKLGGK